jgi:hypothetical protein
MYGSSYDDLGSFSLLLRSMLGVTIAASAVGLWGDWQQVEMLQQHLEGTEMSAVEAAANDGRQAILGGFGLVAYLITMVIFLRWIYLSNRNARALGAQDMEFSPGWSVGWYFVPIASVWKPYHAMKEIFKASHPDHSANWREAPPPGILAPWWIVWLVSGAVGQAAIRTSLRADTPQELLTSTQLSIAGGVLDVLSCLLAIVLVGTLQNWQLDKHHRVIFAHAPAPGGGWPGYSAPVVEPARVDPPPSSEI